jgi:hypothetical protein
MIEDKLAKHYQAENLPAGHPVREAIDELRRLRADAARYHWLLENDQRWSWNPTRYNEAVVSGFSCSGTGYLGYSLEQAIALASWADRVTGGEAK